MRNISPKRYETRGRKRVLPWSADVLQDRAAKYFEKCDSRVKTDVDKDGNVLTVPDPRPYTIEGLCCYLKVTRRTFLKWIKEGGELGERAELIREEIIANRVEGALEGRLNAGFARFTLFNQDPENFKEKVNVENSFSPEASAVLQSWMHGWERKTLLGGEAPKDEGAGK